MGAKKFKNGDEVTWKGFPNGSVGTVKGTKHNWDDKLVYLVDFSGTTKEGKAGDFEKKKKTSPNAPQPFTKNSTDFVATPDHPFKKGDKVKHKVIGISGSTLVVDGDVYTDIQGVKMVKCSWTGPLQLSQNMNVSDLMYWEEDGDKVEESPAVGKVVEPTDSLGFSVGDYVVEANTNVVGKVYNIYNDKSVTVTTVGNPTYASSSELLTKIDEPKFLPGEFAWLKDTTSYMETANVWKVLDVHYHNGSISYKVEYMEYPSGKGGTVAKNDSLVGHNAKYPSTEEGIEFAKKIGAPLNPEGTIVFTPAKEEKKKNKVGYKYNVGDIVLHAWKGKLKITSHKDFTKPAYYVTQLDGTALQGDVLEQNIKKLIEPANIEVAKTFAVDSFVRIKGVVGRVTSKSDDLYTVVALDGTQTVMHFPASDLLQIDEPKFLPGDFAYSDDPDLEVYKVNAVIYKMDMILWKANRVYADGTVDSWELKGDAFTVHHSKYPLTEKHKEIAAAHGAPMSWDVSAEEVVAQFSVGDWVKNDSGMLGQVKVKKDAPHKEGMYFYDVQFEGYGTPSSNWTYGELTPAEAPEFVEEKSKHKFKVGDVVKSTKNPYSTYVIKALESNLFYTLTTKDSLGMEHKGITESILYLADEKKEDKFKAGDIVNHDAVGPDVKYEVVNVNSNNNTYSIKSVGSSFINSGISPSKLTLAQPAVDVGALKKERDELLKKMKEDTVTLAALTAKISALETGVGT